jgi:hypothetical protein
LDAAAPRAARSLVDQLRAGMDGERFEALRQIVGELVAQCVQDGPPADWVDVRLRPGDARLELEISRPQSAVPAGASVEGHRAADIGFRVVDGLVERWGVRDDGETTVVWLTFLLR